MCSSNELYDGSFANTHVCGGGAGEGRRSGHRREVWHGSTWNLGVRDSEATSKHGAGQRAGYIAAAGVRHCNIHGVYI